MKINLNKTDNKDVPFNVWIKIYKYKVYLKFICLYWIVYLRCLILGLSKEIMPFRVLAVCHVLLYVFPYQLCKLICTL